MFSVCGVEIGRDVPGIVRAVVLPRGQYKKSGRKRPAKPQGAVSRYRAARFVLHWNQVKRSQEPAQFYAEEIARRVLWLWVTAQYKACHRRQGFLCAAAPQNPAREGLAQRAEKRKVAGIPPAERRAVGKMEKEIIGTGKTVDEAINSACEQLGVSREQAQWEILDLPKKSLLGIRVTPARVKVTFAQSKTQCAQEYLKEALAEMGLAHTEILVQEREEGVTFTLEGEGLGVIIGRRGETLDALQYLTGLAANKMDGDYFRVTIDSGHYRQKREKTLGELAERLAKNAVRSGRSSTLEPMNPYERRIIHAAVQKVEGASSASFGEEPNRRVVISSKNPVRSGGYGSRPPYSGDRKPYGNKPQGDRPRTGDRPYGDRKPYSGDRKPYGDRPQGDRPQGDRPYGERKPYNNDRKPYSGDRKPYGSRPQGDRPQGDRPPYGERKPYNSGERRPYSGDRQQSQGAPSQQPKATPTRDAEDKPLYSKIELD